MTTKVGNEINHLGTIVLEQDFTEGAMKRKIVKSAKIAAEFILVCALFGVIFLWCVALS